MRLTLDPRPVKGRFSRVTLTLRSASGAPVRGATIRASGAGVAARAARAGRLGTVRLRLRPTRRGTLVVRAVKAGFQPTTYSIAIR